MWAGTAAALSAGDPDPAFGSGGAVYYSLGSGPSPSARLDAVALQPDGKILVAGRGTDANGQDSFLVARLNSDGSLDTSFAVGGVFMPQLGTGSPATSAAHAIALQPDGKIVVGGEANGSPNGFMLIRLNSNGTPDADFGDGGKVFAGFPSDGPDYATVNALTVQPDGKVVAAGSALFSESTHATDELMVARLNGSSGSPDGSFGTGGLVLKQLSSGTVTPHTEGYALALRPDGDIVVAGTVDPGFASPMVALLNGVDGGFDDSFGDAGIATYSPGTPGLETGGILRGVALTPGGDLIAGGRVFGQGLVGEPAALVKLKSGDGTLDSSFGDGGQVFDFLGAGPSPQAQISSVVAQPDGEIVVGGFATDTSGGHRSLIGRLSGSSGAADSGFGSGGYALRQLDGGVNPASELDALTLQPDGNIVAAGFAGSRVVVQRLLGAAPAGPGDGSTGGGGAGGGNQQGPQNLVATISKLGITPTVFAAAPSGPSIAKTIGAQVSYENSQAATTMLTVLKPARGVRSKGSCVKPSPRRHGKRCTRWVAVGRFPHSDTLGLNSFHFTGRVYGRKLKPGRYRLRARPRFAGPAGTAIETGFRIVK